MRTCRKPGIWRWQRQRAFHRYRTHGIVSSYVSLQKLLRKRCGLQTECSSNICQSHSNLQTHVKHVQSLSHCIPGKPSNPQSSLNSFLLNPLIAGPSITSPSGSKRLPWHVQSQLPEHVLDVRADETLRNLVRYLDPHPGSPFAAPKPRQSRSNIGQQWITFDGV